LKTVYLERIVVIVLVKMFDRFTLEKEPQMVAVLEIVHTATFSIAVESRSRKNMVLDR